MKRASYSPPVEPAPALLTVDRYGPRRHPAPTDLRLDGNEGLLDFDPERALRSAPGDIWRRYPDARSLETAIARRFGLPAEAVLVTAGADDGLERAIRAVAAPGREVVLTEPTFEMLPRYVRLAGADPATVPWWREAFPVREVAARIGPATAAVVIASPNNPTGAVLDPEALEYVAAACGRALLVLDHAYVEFAGEDLTRVALRHPNAVVLRTLSKAWGLAGLRVGYVLGDPRVIELLRRVAQPYPVSGPSLVVAGAALETVDLEAAVAGVRRRRDLLGRLLRLRGAQVQPSEANFVLVRFPDADWVRDGLAGLGIAVRGFGGDERLREWLRVTVPPDDGTLARLTEALDTVLAPEALLLDMDGVLADVSGSYREAIRRTAASYGVELRPEEISAAKAAGGANDDWELTRRLLAARGVDVPLAEVVGRFETSYQGTAAEPGLRERERLLPGRPELEALARRLPLAVVTGRPRADAEAFLDRFGIAGLIRVLVAMEDAPGKPDPAPVRLALKRLGVRRAWMVGDTPDDVRAARAAGVLPLGMVPPGEARERWSGVLLRAGAGRVLVRLDDLLEVLP